VLAGAGGEESAHRLRRLLTSFEWIPADAAADLEGAARIYRVCRSRGFNPRRLVDCVIASIAMRTGAAILAADRDFERMAEVVPLDIDRA
jgi:hypothetical protein